MRMLASRIDHHVSEIDRSDLPIFSQDWWLSIVRASPDYREAKVVQENVVIGRLPYVLLTDRPGFIWGYNPHWSRLAGPIIDPRLGFAEQAEVISSLIEQLPRWASFDLVCDANLPCATIVRNGFKQAGFEHTTQITYVRFPEYGKVLEARTAKHRGHIKRAARDLHCVDISAEEFAQLFEEKLNAEGKKSYSPLDLLTRLIDEAVSRGQARVIAAKAKSGNLSGIRDGSAFYDAAIVYVWDNERCYYWLSARRIPPPGDTAARPHPDALKFLAVKAMEEAQAMNLIFDADGVTTPGTDNLYRNIFGLREEQHRDVYQRLTVLQRLRFKYHQLKESLAS